VPSSEMLTLIETDLSTARRIAEHVAEHPDDCVLLQLIDMAILEVKAKLALVAAFEKKARPCSDRISLMVCAGDYNR